MIPSNYLTFIPQQLFQTEEEAINQVSRGKAWASMIFSHNYSEALVERSENIRSVEEWTLDAASVAVSMDMSS